MADDRLKRCPDCKVFKSVEMDYYKTKKGKPIGYCKPCANARRTVCSKKATARLPKKTGFMSLPKETRDLIQKGVDDGDSNAEIELKTGVMRNKIYYYKWRGQVVATPKAE